MSAEHQVCTTPAELARQAADFVETFVAQKPDARLLVATGNTPMPTYTELARRQPDFSRVRAFQLDEYVGVSDDDPRSLYAWMHHSFVEPLGIKRVLRFDPDLEPEAACKSFAQRVKALGGIDLAILGLGPNGHLGFNEPPSDPQALTRVVTLSAESLASNAPYWGELEVPRHALTAGMDLILDARMSLLLVTGAQKRDILHRTLHGPLTPEVPASYLRTTPLTVMSDQAAA